MADETPLEDLCEGCGVRDTGNNFAHEGLCKRCMDGIMGAPEEELLSREQGSDALAKRLASNADEKAGPLKSWKDDGGEVEVSMPLPDGVIKADLQIKTTRETLIVLAKERQLLLVDPLYDTVVMDGTTWQLDAAKRDPGAPNRLLITLEKAHTGSRWGKQLCQEGGSFECWLAESNR
jgi:hypothetical protein